MRQRGVATALLAALLAALLTGSGGLARAQTPSFEEVVERLADPDRRVRIDALRLLKAARHPEAIVPVAELLTDPDDLVQLEAIDTELELFLAAPLEMRARVALVIELRHPPRPEAAFEAGPSAVLGRAVPVEVIDGLLAAVSDPTPRVRIDALYALGAIARPPARPEVGVRLAVNLVQGNEHERLAAARVLGRLRVVSAGEGLIDAMNDSDERVVLAATEALGWIGEPRAVEAITARLEYYAGTPRMEVALDALARIASPTSRPLFHEHLEDRVTAVRALAAEGLGRVGDPDDLGPLQAVLGAEKDRRARVSQAFALYRLGQPLPQLLVTGLVDQQTAERAEALLYETGVSAATDLASYLTDPSPEIRAATARVIGLVGGQESMGSLEALRTDERAEVADAADLAIRRIRTRLGLE